MSAHSIIHNINKEHSNNAPQNPHSIYADITAWIVLLIYVGVLCYTQMIITEDNKPTYNEQHR